MMTRMPNNKVLPNVGLQHCMIKQTETTKNETSNTPIL